MTSQTVTWRDPELESIASLKLEHCCDVYLVRYCLGYLKNGAVVQVRLPFAKLPCSGLRTQIVKEAKRAGVYAKGLNIFNVIDTGCQSYN